MLFAPEGSGETQGAEVERQRRENRGTEGAEGVGKFLDF